MQLLHEHDLIADSICRRKGAKLISYLGGGAFKHAYLIRSSTGEFRALKVLQHAYRSPRTQREVAAMYKCDHLSVAKLFEFDQQQHGEHMYDYIVEEYLSGGSLGDYLTENGPLTAPETIHIGKQLASALIHLHDLGFVHRDIKPDNIMFRKSTEAPVLVDFGLVRDLNASSLTQTWAQIGPGTPFFASPEQLNNEKRLIDWRSDQFSLGVTLFFAMFGRHPFQSHEGDHPSAIIERVAERQSPPLVFQDAIDGTALLPLKQMLAPWPVERYRHPQDLLAAWQS